MNFKVKAKVKIHNQFDWRFWFKLICAILPLVSIIIFICAQSVDMFKGTMAEYWESTLGYVNHKPVDSSTRVQSFGDLVSMTSSDAAAYLFARNILMITTLGNILNAAWFINSAFNNKYEGQGRWDNQVYGNMAIGTIIFIVLFYNLSLIPSHDILHHMKWYNWESWMVEHIFPDLAMMIYFFVFYPKMKTNVTKKKGTREWFAEMGIAISFIVSFNVFFLILGYILKAAHTTRIFGEMSWSGYFPYPFYNFLNDNKQVVGHGDSSIEPWMEFVVVMIIQLIEQVAAFAAIKAQNKWQERIHWMWDETCFVPRV